MGSCQICQNLKPESLHQLSKGQRAIFFANLGEVKKSVSSSDPCPECGLIWQALSLYKQDWDNTNYDKFVELYVAVGKPLRLNWHDDSIQLELFDGYRDGNNTASDNISSGHIGPANLVSEHSGQENCFKLVASWLEACMKSHSSCPADSATTLPTRVIDVGSSAHPDPFIVETNGATGQYIALSYCWGGPLEQLVKTTVQTFEKHKQRIDLSTLSKTLQDAITLTRRLGIKYLWVDALCIIQGDADDWARESSKMCDVYMNALLTISADNSTGCSKGMFNRQVYGVSDQKIPYKDGRFMSVRKAFAQEHDRYSLNMRSGVNAEPITCRAWTLQESFLSNRIARYTNKELVWECNQSWHCECGSASGKKELDDYDESYVRNARLFAQLPLDRIHEQWEQMVMRFSERSFTNEQDKLPALSGLAAQFANVLQLASGKDVYLAGLWRSNLARSLRWYAEDDLYRVNRKDNLPHSRSKTWRAPSWSWAAIEAPINFTPRSQMDDCLEIIEAVTTPSTVDTHGIVSSGKLMVKGRIRRDLPLEILPRRQDRSGMIGYIRGIKYALRVGDEIRTFHPDTPDDFAMCQMGLNPDTRLVCLMIGEIKNNGWWVDQEDVFLVLRQEKGSQDVFRRVGVSMRAYQEDDVGWDASFRVVRLFENAAEEVVTII